MNTASAWELHCLDNGEWECDCCGTYYMQLDEFGTDIYTDGIYEEICEGCYYDCDNQLAYSYKRHIGFKNQEE